MTANVSSEVEKSYPFRQFLLIWLGQSVSLLGSQIVQFALIWYLTAETGSGTVLATATIVGLLPQVLLGPIAGALVDRWNRRWVMFWSDTFIAVATLGLLFLFLSGNIAIWHIYALMFVRALGGAFHNPAMSASTALMVPPAHLTRIAGFNQMIQGGLNIISAPLGALAVTLLPMESVLLIDVLTAAFAVVPLLFIAVPQPPVKQDTEGLPLVRASVLSDLKQGFRYVWEWRGLRLLILMAVVLNFVLSPVSALLPLLVVNHFGGGPMQLGLIESGFGIGIFAGGLLLGVWGGFKRKMFTSLSGMLGISVGIALLGLAPADMFVLAVVGSVIAGMTQPLANGPIIATLQERVEPDMQGRVMTLLISGATAAAPLGLIIAGPLSDVVGVQPLFVGAGIITAVTLVYAFSQPDLLNLDQTGEGGDTTPPDIAASVTKSVPVAGEFDNV
jgi:DHA3 family macrolide efflux protein-like MFS transporter